MQSHVQFFSGRFLTAPARVLVCGCADSMDGCATDCNGNGECVAGHCHCFAGFLGPDCAKGKRHRPVKAASRVRTKVSSGASACPFCSLFSSFHERPRLFPKHLLFNKKESTTFQGTIFYPRMRRDYELLYHYLCDKSSASPL